MKSRMAKEGVGGNSAGIAEGGGTPRVERGMYRAQEGRDGMDREDRPAEPDWMTKPRLFG